MRIFIFILPLLPECIHMFSIVNGTYGKPISINCTIPEKWQSVRVKIKDEIGYKFAVFSFSCTIPSYARHAFIVSCHENTLTVKILRPNNNTVWQCLFDSDGKEYVNSTKVFLLPEMPVVSLLKDTYVITEGSDLTLPCTFIGAPISNVTWQRENNIIQWSLGQSQSFNLSLKNVSRDMAGNYTCSVTVDCKGVCTDSNTLTLVVKYPPTLMPDSELVVYEGQPNVSLSCEILENGFPANYITVRWQHFVDSHLIRNLTTKNHQIDLVNSSFSLVLKSVSFNDTGSYLCTIGNGVPNLKGSMEQIRKIDLIVQSSPYILHKKARYHGEIGKVFSVLFQCVGKPDVSSLKINAKEEGTGPSFNVSVVDGSVEVVMYDTLLYVNGTLIEMEFGVIKDWFNTTYELIAENAWGTKKHAFFVDSHDFPRNPYHVHFKQLETETTVLLEWEAAMPDVDKQYEIIVKNLSGNVNVYRVQGTNSQIYEYQLTNLVQQSNIIQICTTNHIGRNCSTTFKIKMTQDFALGDSLKMKLNHNFLYPLLITGLVVFLVLAITLWRCSGSNRRKGLRMGSGRYDTDTSVLFRTATSNGLENGNITERETSLSVNTYIAPQCMISHTPESPSSSCLSNIEGNEYASVDDADITKLAQQREQDRKCEDKNGGYCEIKQKMSVKYVKK